MNVRADVVGATKILEREIEEEEIVCQIQSFIMIARPTRPNNAEDTNFLTPF
jgi:hypothetical protein